MPNNQKRKPPGKQSGEKGFTLIELGVAIFLIGLILFIATPKIQETMLGSDLERVANHLTGTARGLRSDAVSNQIDHILHLDLDNARIWIVTADMTPEARDTMRKSAYTLPEAVKIMDIYFSEEEKIIDGETTIRFSRKNYTQPAVIHLAENDRRITLVFEPFMNSVKTYDMYVDFQDHRFDW